MTLWLYDASRALTTAIPEYESAIVTRKFGDHSTWTAKLPLTARDALDAAYLVRIGAGTEPFLIDHLEEIFDDLTKEKYLTASGRSATALLHDRTVYGNNSWLAHTPGAIVTDLIATLTGDRAIAGFSMGTGGALGTSRDMQQSWGDMGQVIVELLASANLGFRARLTGTTIYFDIYEPGTGDPIGEVYGNAAGGKITTDQASWKNFAYVLGEGEDTARVMVTVDLTGTDPRKELYVDARDLPSVVDEVTLTSEQYEATLTQRGLERLAETRRIEFAEATTDSPLEPGDVTLYDAGRWVVTLMVTETTETHEGGRIKHGATLGEPPPSFRRMIRRTIR